MILHRNAKWAVCIMGMSLCFLMGCKKDEIVETVTEPVIEEVTPEDIRNSRRSSTGRRNKCFGGTDGDR